MARRAASRRATLAAALVLLLAAAAAAAVTFTLSSTAGVRGVPTGITDAKFPGPVVSRDPLVPPFLVFDAVDRRVTAATSTTPQTVTWPTWKCSVRADAILGIEQGRDEYADYVILCVIAPLDLDAVAGPQFLPVRGDLDRVLAIVAKTTGTRRIDVTFEETR